MEYVIRFLIGGVAVSAFAVLGDAFRPKSFAGLFGAAPSIALATLALAIAQHGNAYAAIEARSMMLGAIALWLYSSGVCRLMKRHRLSAWAATLPMLAVWLTCAFGLRWLLLGAG